TTRAQAPGGSFRAPLAGALLAPLEAPDVHKVPPGTALAAVLVPLLMAGGDVRVVFPRRTHTLSRHAGEISFPGGLAEPDEELPAAALRESEEELGLAPADVEL